MTTATLQDYEVEPKTSWVDAAREVADAIVGDAADHDRSGIFVFVGID